jgi:hypothetical protein
VKAPGSRAREQLAERISQAADSAGTLVLATLAIAVCALIIAAAALTVALKLRRPAGH